MARKKIKNVLELAKNLGEDQKFKSDLASHLNSKRLVHKLVAMRAAKGLTQKDLASKMGCTQSRISKFESSVDLDLSFRSIVEYAQAIDVQIELTFLSKTLKTVDRVKHHAFCIKRLTDKLAHLALADEKVAEGVSRFFNEAAFNLMSMLQDSASKLPPMPEEISPTVLVDSCGMDDLEQSTSKQASSNKRLATTATA